ncbi:RNA polymerase sigma factor [Marinobacter pelagius]|nr:sigma-70 family RNA polymerase sigma factor [Marinobacter pelagius]
MRPVETEQRCESTVSEERQRLFRTNVERLMDRLYGTALRMTRDADEAEDVVAESVSKAWRGLDQLDDLTHMEGWLFRILHNTFVSLRRRRQCRQDRELPLDADDGEEDCRFSLFENLHQPFLLWLGRPETEFINHLLEEDLKRAVDDLAEPYRIVLVMVEMQGYSYEQVARILDIPMGTVRSRLSRARCLLQKALWTQGRDAGLTTHGTRSTAGDEQ